MPRLFVPSRIYGLLSGALVGASPFLLLLQRRIPQAPVLVGAFVVVALLTSAVHRVPGHWLVGAAIGFAIPWVAFGADWRLAI